MKEFLATIRPIIYGLIGGVLFTVALWGSMAVLYKYFFHGLIDWATR